MKKLMLVALATLSLTACGGGEKPVTETPPVVVDPKPPVSETREQMIERELNLPAEPDETENNATILGVDSNGNGIRDDIERYIAFTFYPDKKKMAVLNESARLEREQILNYENDDLILEIARKLAVLSACEISSLSREERSGFYLRAKPNTDMRNDFKIKFIREKTVLHDIDYPPYNELLSKCESLISE